MNVVLDDTEEVYTEKSGKETKARRELGEQSFFFLPRECRPPRSGVTQHYDLFYRSSARGDCPGAIYLVP